MKEEFERPSLFEEKKTSRVRCYLEELPYIEVLSFLFFYSHMRTMFVISPLFPSPPPLTPHPFLSPPPHPRFQAETILTLSLILW
jgi:hypothetical protein